MWKDVFSDSEALSNAKKPASSGSSYVQFQGFIHCGTLESHSWRVYCSTLLRQGSLRVACWISACNWPCMGVSQFASHDDDDDD